VTRRKRILQAAILLSAVGSWFYASDLRKSAFQPTIKVGLLHSQTGTMALSEKAVLDATLLAIDEINEAGGLLGRRIEPVIIDGCSDSNAFARGAERLITEERVSAIFGCWTSASRKAVKPIVERHDHLLFYPVQYEGLEQSPNIVCTGQRQTSRSSRGSSGASIILAGDCSSSAPITSSRGWRTRSSATNAQPSGARSWERSSSTSVVRT